MSQQVRVTFEPDSRTVFVLPGTKMTEAAARAGLTLDAPCGGAGTCGKCRLLVTAGACEPGDTDKKFFSDAELAEGWRLACQTAICGETTVTVPEGSRFASQHQILMESHNNAADEVMPAVRKVHVKLNAPSLEDDMPDLTRLDEAIGQVKVDLNTLRAIPQLLRQSGWEGTAVLTDHHLIDFEPGDTTDMCLGVAFDIGTTTVVASLLNLCDGSELAIASDMNPQTRFGDDVITRIMRCTESDTALAEQQAAIIETVNSLIAELCTKSGKNAKYIYEVSFAGNTTMEHLLCGLDPQQLGQIPFVPAHGRGLMFRASELKLNIHPQGAAYVFPVMGGFVGGDTVAGTLSTKLSQATGATLMVDIGTNGEIVLAHGGKLLAASTAAGPAFEGARISCGMRATNGAIEKVVITDDLEINVIGNAKPVGLCGSGLIDLAADMLEVGIISPEGRLLTGDELPADLPSALRDRVIESQDGQPAFLLAESPRGPITLNQRDIRELQLAAGSIRAGIKILLKQADLATSDLAQVLIAGGFGSFIRRNKAQRIGLLPGDVDHTKIRYVGNASLDGARWALLSTRARKQAEQLARDTQHVELSQDMNFQMEFAEAMIFPEN